MSRVSFKGILVRRDFTSKLARNLSVTSSSHISLVKEKEESAVYSFLVMGLIMGTKYFAMVKAVVLHAERMVLIGQLPY